MTGSCSDTFSIKNAQLGQDVRKNNLGKRFGYQHSLNYSAQTKSYGFGAWTMTDFFFGFAF